MRKSFAAIALSLLIALPCIGFMANGMAAGDGLLHETAAATKWEYKVVMVSKPSGDYSVIVPALEDQLNELGKDGWELSSTVSHQFWITALVLKRPAR